MARLFRTPAEVVAERQAAPGQDTEEHDTLAAANEPAPEAGEADAVEPSQDDKPKPRRRRPDKPA